jgi:hypothetical protein
VEKGRVADDHVGVGPGAFVVDPEKFVLGGVLFGAGVAEIFRLFAEGFAEEGVFVFETVKRAEDGGAVVVVAVVAAPLERADLHGDLGEFVGVRVDLDGAELGDIDPKRQGERELGGEGDDFFFEIEEEAEGDVEEISRAAGGVEDDGGGEFFLEGGEAVAVGFGAAAFRERGGERSFQCAPLAAERSHEDGFDEGDDVGFGGVVRAELGTLGGLEGAFEERAHDAGLDTAPIGLGGGRELADFLGEKFEDGGVFEEVAVEVADGMRAVEPAGGHRAEEGFEGRGEVGGIVVRFFQDAVQEFFREQGGVFGEKTENDTVQETRDAEILLLRDGDLAAIAGVAEFDGLAALERTGDHGDRGGERFGDLRGRLRGAKMLRILEEGAENAQMARLIEAVVGELVDFENGAVEIGADDEAVEVAGDEERWIFERLAVAEELAVGGVEVGVFAFVFPAEATAPPHVGETAARGGGRRIGRSGAGEFEVFDDVFLETKPIARPRDRPRRAWVDRAGGRGR